MPKELGVVFEAALQKALNFLSERGFNRELRQEQKSSVKQLFTGRDLLVDDDHVVLVICPLKSIVNRIKSRRPLRWGFRLARCLTASKQTS